MTITTSWERNATIPKVRYVPAIIPFLGYSPLPPANSLAERLATARRSMGLSQRKMAVKPGVDPATLMGWEAERIVLLARAWRSSGQYFKVTKDE